MSEWSGESSTRNGNVQHFRRPPNKSRVNYTGNKMAAARTLLISCQMWLFMGPRRVQARTTQHLTDTLYLQLYLYLLIAFESVSVIWHAHSLNWPDFIGLGHRSECVFNCFFLPRTADGHFGSGASESGRNEGRRQKSSWSAHMPHN